MRTVGGGVAAPQSRGEGRPRRSSARLGSGDSAKPTEDSEDSGEDSTGRTRPTLQGRLYGELDRLYGEDSTDNSTEDSANFTGDTLRRARPTLRGRLYEGLYGEDSAGSARHESVDAHRGDPWHHPGSRVRLRPGQLRHAPAATGVSAYWVSTDVPVNEWLVR